MLSGGVTSKTFDLVMCFQLEWRIVWLTVERRREMARLELLDPTKTGKQAQDLESKLRRFVVGQEEAIQQIVTVYQSHVTGLSPAGRPIGNFLFLGPTGSGKTRIVEATAQAL